MVYLLAHASSFFGLAVVFACTGWLLQRALPRPLPAPCGRPVLTIAVGMVAWCAILFVLAVVQGFRPWVLRGLALVPVAGALAVGAFSLRRSGGLRAAWAQRGPRQHRTAWLLGPAVVLAALGVLTLSPELYWDDNTYQLLLPRLFLEHGGFRHVAYNLQSHWPLNLNLLYGLALALHDHVLAKLLHFGVLFLLVLSLYSAGSRWRSPTVGAVAAALVLANSVVLFEGRVAYVDLAVALFFFLGFLFACEYLDTGRRAALLLAGVFSGAVAGIKLPGAACAVMVAGLVLVGKSTFVFPWRARVRAAAWVGGLAFLLAAPWYVKSWWDTGNPVYPFLFERFGGMEWSAQLSAQCAAWQSGMGMGRSLRDYALLPWRVVMAGALGLPHFGESISGAWLVLVPLALVGAVRDSLVRRSLAMAGAYFVFWALSSQQMRFLTAALPLLSLAAAVALARFAEARADPAARAGLVTALTAAGWMLLGYQSAGLYGPAVATVERLATTPADALLASAEHPIYRFIREQTPPDARLMLLNTNHGFFLRREYIADTAFECSTMNELLQSAGSAEGLSGLAAARGLTHLLVEQRNWGIAYPAWLQGFLVDPSRVEAVHRSGDGRYALYRFVRP